MCVIIHKPEGVTIPSEKIESACIVNNHGYGFAIHDRGKLLTEKDIPNQGIDPDYINRKLEEYKDNNLWLHLRFRTQGNINKKNCHPFTVLTKETHGVNVGLMHNGTLSGYKDDTNSDTYVFNQQIVRPLLIRSLSSIPAEKLLEDRLILKVLDELIPYSSVVVLFDQFGNQHIFNKNKGTKFDEGWWASNSYSFNRTHRKPTNTTVHSNTNKGKVHSPTHPTNSYFPSHGSKPNDPISPQPYSSSIPKSGTTEESNTKKTEVWLGNKYPVLLSPQTPVQTKRESITDFIGSITLEEFCQLSFGDLNELTIDYPDETATLLHFLQKKAQRYLADQSTKSSESNETQH